jgi:2-aminoethylphosphonate dioxygenase
MATRNAALSDEKLRQYRDDGYLILRGVLAADEIGDLERETSALWWRQDLIDKDNIRCRWKDHATTGECTFECFDPVIDLGPVCAQLLQAGAWAEQFTFFD